MRKVKDVMVKGLRLWKLNDSSDETIDEYDSKHWNYTLARIDATLMVAEKPDKVMKVDDLNFVDEDVFLVETNKQDGSFPLVSKNQEE